MSSVEPALPEDSIVLDLAGSVADAGGRVVLVGGWVRDQLLGEPAHDLDLEIFGLETDSISSLLRPFGFTAPVGRQFPVWRHNAAGIDASEPRAGSGLFSAGQPDSLERAYREASRHRDLTCNAIGWDPLAGHRSSAGGAPAGALIDPWDGRADLDARRLRAVDLTTFGSDPLRLLRVARLAARLGAVVDESLVEVCRGLSLEEVAVERIAGELRRLLTECPRPSVAFEVLVEADQLRVFEPVDALRGVEQDPLWHPEGDVFTHTLLVVDRAAEIAADLGASDCEILMFAALCHDLGKPETTTREGDRVRALGHEAKSAEAARRWLESLRIPERSIAAIEVLVAHHLAPSQFVSQGAGARAYRRLARKLAAGDRTVVDLERLARADHLGRTTEDAREGRFDAGARFLESADAAAVRCGVRDDVVSAADLIERGIQPGPRLGRLLARCRELEDETGAREAGPILERVLGEAGSN